jgi:type VI protein secretion system component VasF
MSPELQALQAAIEMLHQLMTVMPDPKHTQVVAKCLQALTQVQQELMTQGGGSPQDALMQQLQGGGPAGALAGGGGAPPPGY